MIRKKISGVGALRKPVGKATNLRNEASFTKGEKQHDATQGVTAYPRLSVCWGIHGGKREWSAQGKPSHLVLRISFDALFRLD